VRLYESVRTVFLDMMDSSSCEEVCYEFQVAIHFFFPIQD